jgi:hypothetical protein
VKNPSLREFMTDRGLTIEVRRKDGDAMHARVPADQEAGLCAALDEWTRTRTALYFKRPQPPTPEESGHDRPSTRSNAKQPRT